MKNNNQEQDERATRKSERLDASQSKSNKRDMGNSAPVDLKELRTLKDLTSWTCECNCVTFDGEICRSCGKKPKYGEIDYDELKDEVIKWVKEDIFSLENADMGAYDILERWIKRLNLTEEDLK